MGLPVIVYHMPAFDPESPVVNDDGDVAAINTSDLMLQMSLFFSITSWARYYKQNNFIVQCAPANLEQVREFLRRFDLAGIPACSSEPDLTGYDRVLEVLTPYSLARGPPEGVLDLVTDADAEYVYCRPGSPVPLLKAYRLGAAKARAEAIEDVSGTVDFYARRGDENYAEILSLFMVSSLKRVMGHVEKPEDEPEYVRHLDEAIRDMQGLAVEAEGAEDPSLVVDRWRRRPEAEARRQMETPE